MDNSKKQQKIGRFDQVRILTTKRVSYLSAPLGVETTPNGLWSVTSIINNNELLLAQMSCIIRIPAEDVLLVVNYDLNEITKNLGRLSRGERKEGKEEESSSSDKSDPIG